MFTLQKIRPSFEVAACFCRLLSTSQETNDTINPYVFNRNPRNLERLRLAKKPVGYNLEKSSVNFWHKMVTSQSKKHLTAEIVHNNGNIVVRASTSEWAVRKFLYKTNDRTAYINLAKVFTERCLESGIEECYCEDIAEEGTKLDIFLKTVEQEGLALKEAKYYDINLWYYQPPEKKPWLVQDES